MNPAWGDDLLVAVTVFAAYRWGSLAIWLRRRRHKPALRVIDGGLSKAA